MSIESFLLARFGYLKVADVVSIPGLPFHQAIPRHIYDEQRRNGSLTEKDQEVLFRSTAKRAWLYTLLGLGIGIAARPFSRPGVSFRSLARAVTYAAPIAGLLGPIIVEFRTQYMLEDPARVAEVLGKMRVESIRWWIDVRREIPGAWDTVIARAEEGKTAGKAQEGSVWGFGP